MSTVGPATSGRADDLSACVERAPAAGGRVLMPATAIPDVGTVAFIADPGGNPIGFIEHAS